MKGTRNLNLRLNLDRVTNVENQDIKFHTDRIQYNQSRDPQYNSVRVIAPASNAIYSNGRSGYPSSKEYYENKHRETDRQGSGDYQDNRHGHGYGSVVVQ